MPLPFPHRLLAIAVVGVASAACQPSQDSMASHAVARDAPVEATTPRTPPAARSTATTEPPADPRPDPTAERPTPADEASPQAAAATVGRFFDLLAASRLAEADALWRDAAAAAAFRDRSNAIGPSRVEVDEPGPMEGAAGSSYVTVPIRLIPPPGAQNPRPRNGEALLRRVNDVPGSTAAQRRWHIERIDIAMTPK